MAIFVSLAPLTLLACGSDTQSGNEEISRQLDGIAGLAVGAYASSGPEAIFDYLSSDAAAKCPAVSLNAALSNETQPTGFREVKDVHASGNEATATVVIKTKDGDKASSWKFVRNDSSWRIDDMPGLEKCRS